LSAFPHTAVILAVVALATVVAGVLGVVAGLTFAAGLLWRLRRAAALAHWQATHDEVTGLPNRRAVLTLLDRAAENRRPHGLVLLDLDRFKTVNDTYGHEAGDDLLGQVGARLAALPAPVALAARLSGDEFVLLVYGTPADVQAAAHAAWHAVRAAPAMLGDHPVTVQASVGYAYARPGGHPRDLLGAADLAMYRAKTGTAQPPQPGPAHPGQPPGRCRDWPRP
jgi:diguanylate cyclase (GGDEF)-like protein